MKLVIKMSVTLVAVMMLAAAPAHAQSCKTMYTYFFGEAQGIPAGSFDGSSPGSYTYNYWMMTACAPVPAPIEVCAACAAARQAQAGRPIMLTTGDTYIRQADVQVSGLGGGLGLVRVWNSIWPFSQSALNVGMFGPNWRANYEERIFLGDDHYIRYSRGGGSYWSFAFTGWNPDYSSSYHVVAPANVTATLTSGTNWTLTFQDGEQRVFDSVGGALAGKLLAIVDRNGNTTQLTYDAGNRLATVTDPAGRHLNFTYGTGNSYYLVASVTAAGLSVAYTYDPTSLLLTKVTNPDGTFSTFEYDANSLVSAVKDTDGKVLESHTYDALGRGLTSSRAGGVDAVTVSYPQ